MAELPATPHGEQNQDLECLSVFEGYEAVEVDEGHEWYGGCGAGGMREGGVVGVGMTGDD